MKPSAIQSTLDETKRLLLQSTLKLSERGYTAEHLEASAVHLQETSRQFVIVLLPWHRRSWELVKRGAQSLSHWIPFYYCCARHEP